MLAETLPLRSVPSLDELLTRGRAQLNASPREALADAVHAVALADASGDPEQQATARRLRGDVNRVLGQHEAALVDYAQAGRFYRRLRMVGDAARTDASAVDCLSSMGRFAEALRLAARARRVFRRMGEQLRSAVLDEIVGLVYFQQDDYARALKMFHRARPVVAAAGRAKDLATLNHNMASALTNMDRLREAEELYAAARGYYAQQGAGVALARVDVNLAYLAYRQGRYGAAIDTLRRAADVFDNLRSDSLAVVTRLDLADTYLALNLLDEAAALSQEQLKVAGERGMINEQARAQFYLSTVRGRTGQVDAALAGLVDAEDTFARQGNLVWRTRCELGRAALLAARGGRANLAEAQTVARRAERAFGRLGLPSRQAAASIAVARAQLGRGRARAAEESARLALSLAEELGVPWLLFESHYMLGRTLRSQGQSERAYAAYWSAAEALERVRAELAPEELRVALVSDKTDVYQELVLLCLDRGVAEEALQHAERAKSRAFTERLTGSVEVELNPHVVGSADAAVLERMRRLRHELVWLYSRLSEGDAPRDGHASAQTHRLRREVATREAELVRLQRRLQPASRPQAAALGLAGPDNEASSAISALRRRLPAGSVVLEYFQAGDELVLFIFDRVRLSAHRLGPIERINDLVDRFRFQVAKFGLGEAYVRAHAKRMQDQVDRLLVELYSALIDPVADELVDAQRLIVVPHGSLHYLPFHALIDPSGTPLVERVEISYAPSAGVLASCYERPALPEGRGRRMLFGVPNDAIPQVEGEIDALTRMFGPANVFSGDAATEYVFRHHAPEADIIHLASHAVFREDNPLFSAIQLSDTWLSLYDLYSLRLHASLVTLSACETGLSQVLAGDELVGLTRGFFQAGTASVVVSLWAVNDASTACLMERFYGFVEEGFSPAAAMRAAQTVLRRIYPHPYHWAPFLVVGRP
ncbi:MAG TPA: CHAT domain-containing tetratricopeptide repeat protein [Chloroflexota bacterium]